MSRDLSFWRTNKNLDKNNREIYTILSAKEYLLGVEELPLAKILLDINKVFSDWENHDNQYYEKNNESFQLMLTNQFVRVDCYGMTAGSMNDIIDILAEYGCPLYDSSIDVRFD